MTSRPLRARGRPLWARSRATAGREHENGAVLWQGVPGLRGPTGPVFRVPSGAAGPVS
ncbi:hypothetical protein [Streptomyces sp. NPDC088358]|uniref:hypothetical protein n=1 Tax=Streptomyces sp. NPDC088358 TaxID=3365857 RepID=UPI00381E5F26